MKVLLSWLQELAPFPDDPELIGDTLSDLGTPVEAMERIGEGWDGIVVARVLDLRPHPDADRIQLVDVDPGDGGPLQIGCGAFNMAVGDLVPLATIGSTVPGGLRIERRKLRGEWSNGMLCSSRELGLGGDHAGIRILEPGAAPGTSLAEALGVAPDVLYELEVNPNRPDAMSVAGIARDLAARLHLPFALPEPTVATAGAPAGSATTVEVLAPELCGRFTAWVLRDVTVGTSPEWMQRRLTALGMRPINALVDISNYVMLELGQPNHPYDLHRVAGGGFRVRRARTGEGLVTLDDVERTLTRDDLLICDGDDRAVGIAGIMGGAAGEISESTTDVLLEMAWFSPAAVSRTSRRLGLRSEASARFEKGCDPEGIDRAARRFCQLATEICGAVVAPGSARAQGDLPSRAPVRVRPARVNALLGTDLTADHIRDQIEPIGFACAPVEGDLDVMVPTWRPDTTTEVDVVEEVARHWGYRAIPIRQLSQPRSGGLTARQARRRGVRRLLAGLGLAECLPLPFLAPGQLEACGLPPGGIELLNPMVAEESVLRPSLLPGLVQATALNAARRRPGVALFEIGHVFGVPPPGQVLPDEREHLAVLLAGREAPAAVATWLVLADQLRAEAPDVENAEVPGLHPTRAGRVLVAGPDGATPVGTVGEVDPAVLAGHGVEERVAWLEVDLGALLDGRRRSGAFRPVSRFPSSDVDLAFEVPEATSAIAVERTLAGASPLVWSVRLFDVFRGAQVAEGCRSLAYTLRLQARDHTLTDEEMAAARAACIAAVERAHHAVLRG